MKIHISAFIQVECANFQSGHLQLSKLPFSPLREDLAVWPSVLQFPHKFKNKQQQISGKVNNLEEILSWKKNLQSYVIIEEKHSNLL